MSEKVALISGITGQDGAYLARLLLSQNYIVHGIRRRSSTNNCARISDLVTASEENRLPFYLHQGDLTDMSSLLSIVQNTSPDEIYHLGAQSFVKDSFESPEYTANTNGLGTLRFLETIRLLKGNKTTKFYQASTSELFGKVQEIPQTEKTPFYPRSPYAISKMYAYWTVVNYREAYGIFAANGILFNHESPLRGEDFVTKKIAKSVASIAIGNQRILKIGNLDAKRDWGHAKDYVKAMWLILQHHQPDDWIIASGQTHAVRDFLRLAFKEVGLHLDFQGSNIKEAGVITSINQDLFYQKIGRVPDHLKLGQPLVQIDSRFFRPAEVDLLIGDSTKAKNLLGWQTTYTFEQLVAEMIEYEIQALKHTINMENLFTYES